MRSENLTQSGVQEVGSGVVAHGGPARGDAHFGAQFVVHPNEGKSADFVNREAGNCRARVFDNGDRFPCVCIVESATIANLAAGFSIEGRLVENDFAFGTRFETFDQLLIEQ